MDIYTVLFVVVFIGITLFALWIFRNPVADWKVLVGTIVKYEVKTIDDTLYHHYPSLEYCYPEVEYEYSYQGVSYNSNQVALILRDIYERNDSRAHPWDEWKKGGKVKVFVNPDEPAKAVLLAQMSQERWSAYFVMLLGGYASLLGLYILSSFLL